MRVIVLCNLGKKGAGTAALWSLAQGFQMNPENEVHCILSDEVEDKSLWENNLFSVHYIKTGNRKTFFKKILTFLLFGKKKLESEFNGKKIDYLIFYFCTPWGKIIESALKPRITLTVCHDPIPHKGESVINKLLCFMEYKRARFMIVMTEQYKSLVSKKFSLPLSHIYYMPHGLYKNYIITDSKKIDNWYSNDKINYLFFGRIEKYKGIKLLVDAFIDGYLYESSTLTIAGSGDLSFLGEKIKKVKNIRIINRFISDDEIATLFNFDNVVCVIPYTEASQSGVIAIAAEFLTPIISSDVEGLVEQLDHGNVGVFFQNNNKTKLIEAMKLFLEDNSCYEKQKQLLFKYREMHSWERISFNLIEELENGIN